ncbi:unnamed protein product, partial [Didymodactylos carnosus]
MDRGANEYSDLFYHSVQVLNNYTDDVSEENFLEQYFQENDVPDRDFISTVLFDCVRHSTLLRTVMEIFYSTDGINVRRSEQNMYKVISYIIFFQLDTVGLKLLRGFINTVQLHRMYQFLQFLLNDDRLMAVREECLKLYDKEYFDEKIYRVIKSHLPHLKSVLLDLTDIVEGRSAPRQIQPPTKTKPFKITSPKHRAVPVPQIIPKMERIKPAPKTTYEPSRERIELEKVREENHRKAIEKLEHTRTLKYGFMQTEKSHKTHEKLSKIVEDREKNLQFDIFRANPPPKPQVNKIPVKLNVASVLKESQLYRRHEDEVRRRLQEYEFGARDAQEFLTWQTDILNLFFSYMRKKDYDSDLLELERKRLEGKLSYEEAILAKQRLQDENKRMADEMKEKTREIIDDYVKEKVKDEKRMKQLIEEVIDGRENAKLAQQKLQQYKKDFVKQYKEELKDMMKQALEDAEVEMRQRFELIQQIRAMESVPVDRWKPVDLTTIAGHGVLDEMSIAELRERLELVKDEREKERELKRDQIIKEKQDKEKQITDTVQYIVKFRNELTTAAAV